MVLTEPNKTSPSKVALVTGGSSGIGQHAALAFARAGARVVVADIAVPGGKATAEQINDEGGQALFVPVDVSSATQVEAMIASAVGRFGRIDWAFNNAGVATQRGGAVDDFSEEEWDRILSINLKGVWLCLKYECRQMLTQGAGAIVNTSSILGKVSRPGHSAYSAAKAGVIGLTQSAALDYATKGIRVNAICPGAIATPMTSTPAIKEAMARFVNATPMARMGQPEEIANTVLWLCSDGGSYLTGQAISVDGGYAIW